MRAEHWYDFVELAGDSNLFMHVVEHIAAGSSPTLMTGTCTSSPDVSTMRLP